MAVKLPDFTAVGFEEPSATNVRPSYYTEDPEAAGQTRIGTSLEKLGTGVEQAGTAASLLGGQIQHNTNLANGALAQAKFHNDAATTLAQIERENDPGKVDQLTAQLQGQLHEASQLIPDTGFRNVWLDRHSPELTNFQIAANKRQNQIYDDRYKAGSDGVLQAALQRGTQSDDPAVQEQAKKDIGTVFASQALAGVISQDQATIGARKATQQMILGRVENLYLRNRPQEALDYLSANANQLDAASLSHAAGLAHTLRTATDIQIGDAAYARASSPGGGGGVFTAPEGPLIAGANPAEQQMLNEIRHRENKGNYGKTDRSDDNGGGAYQFADSTWKEATAAAGIGTQYATGAEAPKDVQDAVALAHYRNKGIQPWAASGPYPQPGGGSAVGLIPTFQSSLDRMVDAAAKDGVPLKLGSGFRTYTEQARLYAQYLKEGGAPVARPGTSAHEMGGAMDLRDDSGHKITAGSREDKWLTAHQSEYGIIRPVKGEPWHLQPTTQPSATQAAAAPVAGGGSSLTLPAVPSYTLPTYNPDTGTFSEPPAAATGLGLGPGAPLTPTASYAEPADQDTGVPDTAAVPGALVPGGALARAAAPAPTAAPVPAAPTAAVAPSPAPSPAIAPRPVPGADTPEGQYAITLDRLKADPALRDNPAAYQRAVTKAELAYRADSMRIAGAVRAQKRASDEAQDVYVQRMINGDTDNIIQQIGQDTRLDGPDREHLWKLASSQLSSDTLKQISEQNSLELFRRIHLPDGDPQKITDTREIEQYRIAGKIDWTDLDKLRKEVTDQRTPEGERLSTSKKDFLDAYQHQIDKSNPLLGQIDQSGKEQFYKFKQDLEAKMDEYRREKRDPFLLIRPGTPDYFGKPENIDRYKIPIEESIRNVPRSLGLNPATPAPTPSPVVRPPLSELIPALPPRPGSSVSVPIPPLIAPTQAAPTVPIR